MGIQTWTRLLTSQTGHPHYRNHLSCDERLEVYSYDRLKKDCWKVSPNMCKAMQKRTVTILLYALRFSELLMQMCLVSRSYRAVTSSTENIGTRCRFKILHLKDPGKLMMKGWLFMEMIPRQMTFVKWKRNFQTGKMSPWNTITHRRCCYND
ncbi:hypothetical protein TNCV_4539381 [Trichonephila clavipes]|nr:hypothetical protein TNCV_4539381 [Trichonephila clavipes]